MRPVWVGKRHANRSACLLKSHILIEGVEKPIEVQIVDISSTGARARIDSEDKLPEIFQIHILTRREVRHCKLRWQSDNQAGLEFFSGREADAHKTIMALSERLARLEHRLLDSNQSSENFISKNNDLEQSLDCLNPDNTLVATDLAGTPRKQANSAATIPQVDDRAQQRLSDEIALLVKRLEVLEQNLSEVREQVNQHLSETRLENLSGRFQGFENRNIEILQLLNKLMPILAPKVA